MGEWWRFLSPALLHGSVLHLLVNNFSLNSIGPPLERLTGHKRFLAVYIAAGVTGNALSYSMSTANSLGASGEFY